MIGCGQKSFQIDLIIIGCNICSNYMMKRWSKVRKVVFYITPYKSGKPTHGKDIIQNKLDAIDLTPMLDIYGEEIWLDSKVRPNFRTAT